MAKAGRKFKKRFDELMAQSQSFSVLLDDGTWLCPYCGVPVADRSAQDFEDVALEHLIEECRKAAGLEAETMSVKALNDLIEIRRLKAKYNAEPAWRIRVAGGTWLCPYCVQTTGISMVDASGAARGVDEVIREIRAHFAKCYPYAKSPGTFHSVDEVKEILSTRKREEQETRAISEHMKADPVYQFSDENGRWICPWCEKPVNSVDYSTPLARSSTAPPQVLAHFKAPGCAYKGGALDTGKTLEQMQAVAARFQKKEAAPEPPPGAAGVYIDTLRTELDELRSHLGQDQKLRQDLARARQAQRRMLPSRPPEIAGYQIEVFFRSCDEVSGDFYDFVALPEGLAGIVIGDISGHGVDAGIVMGMAKKAFSLRAQSGADPLTVVTQVNADVAPELERQTFITATYGVLDPQRHTFQFVRCGHTFPLYYAAAGGTVEAVASEGLVLGSITGPVFAKKTEVAEIGLGPGDAIALFTDGINEAMTEEGEEFGLDNTRLAFERHAGVGAQNALEGLMGAVHIFTQGHPQADDQTLIVLRRIA